MSWTICWIVQSCSGPYVFWIVMSQTISRSIMSAYVYWWLIFSILVYLQCRIFHNLKWTPDTQWHIYHTGISPGQSTCTSLSGPSNVKWDIWCEQLSFGELFHFCPGTILLAQILLWNRVVPESPHKIIPIRLNVYKKLLSLLGSDFGSSQVPIRPRLFHNFDKRM
jgi:hypothetical protein